MSRTPFSNVIKHTYCLCFHYKTTEEPNLPTVWHSLFGVLSGLTPSGVDNTPLTTATEIVTHLIKTFSFVLAFKQFFVSCLWGFFRVFILCCVCHGAFTLDPVCLICNFISLNIFSMLYYYMHCLHYVWEMRASFNIFQFNYFNSVCY